MMTPFHSDNNKHLHTANPEILPSWNKIHHKVNSTPFTSIQMSSWTLRSVNNLLYFNWLARCFRSFLTVMDGRLHSPALSVRTEVHSPCGRFSKCTCLCARWVHRKPPATRPLWSSHSLGARSALVFWGQWWPLLYFYHLPLISAVGMRESNLDLQDPNLNQFSARLF